MHTSSGRVLEGADAGAPASSMPGAFEPAPMAGTGYVKITCGACYAGSIGKGPCPHKHEDHVKHEADAPASPTASETSAVYWQGVVPRTPFFVAYRSELNTPVVPSNPLPEVAAAGGGTPATQTIGSGLRLETGAGQAEVQGTRARGATTAFRISRTTTHATAAAPTVGTPSAAPGDAPAATPALAPGATPAPAPANNDAAAYEEALRDPYFVQRRALAAAELEARGIVPTYHTPTFGHDGNWYVITRGRVTGVFRNLAAAHNHTFRVPGHNWSRAKSYVGALMQFYDAAIDGDVHVAI